MILSEQGSDFSACLIIKQEVMKGNTMSEISVKIGGRKVLVVDGVESPNPDYKEASFSYDLGEDAEGNVDLDRAIELFGKETVTAMYVAGMTVAVQNPARNILKEDESNDPATYQATIIAEMSNWKPGAPRRARAVSIDPVAALMQRIQSGQMSTDEMQALMAELQGAFPPGNNQPASRKRGSAA